MAQFFNHPASPIRFANLSSSPQVVVPPQQLSDQKFPVTKQRFAQPATPLFKRELVSTCHGEIERVLITIPYYALHLTDTAPDPFPGGPKDVYRHIYKSLVAKFPPTTHYVIVTPTSLVKDVKELFGPEVISRSEIVEMDDAINFTVWAQDAYAINWETPRNGGASVPCMVDGVHFARRGDLVIGSAVASQTNIQSRQSGTYYQGGNIIIGDDYYLIGDYYFQESRKYFGDLRSNTIGIRPDETINDAILRAYRRDLDTVRELIIVRTANPMHPTHSLFSINESGLHVEDITYFATGAFQSLFHIDMHVTLLGRKNGKRLAAVGLAETAPWIEAKFPFTKDVVAVFNRNLQDTVDFLLQYNFEVFRVPFPLAYLDVYTPSSPPYKNLTRYWYIATYNNCLVEISETRKRIILPTYGFNENQQLQEYLQDTDKRAKEDFEKGYAHGGESLEAVHLGVDCNVLASNGGSLHCITKYIKRNFYAPSK